MILTSTQKVRAYLDGAVTTTQPDFISCWADHNLTTHKFEPDSVSGALNDTTPVDILASPASGFERQGKLITIYNRDTVAIGITVERYDSGTARRWIHASLNPNWSLQWEPGGTWHIYDANGILQTSAGGGGAPGSLTVEEADGSPSYSGITTLSFDQADGFVVSQPGANIAKVNFTGGTGGGNTRRAAWMLGG